MRRKEVGRNEREGSQAEGAVWVKEEAEESLASSRTGRGDVTLMKRL